MRSASAFVATVAVNEQQVELRDFVLHILGPAAVYGNTFAKRLHVVDEGFDVSSTGSLGIASFFQVFTAWTRPLRGSWRPRPERLVEPSKKPPIHKPRIPVASPAPIENSFNLFSEPCERVSQTAVPTAE